MGERTTKGNAVTRYLTGRTGIPMLTWDGQHSRIQAPPPYSFDVVTARKLQWWHDAVAGLRAEEAAASPVMPLVSEYTRSQECQKRRAPYRNDS